MGFIIDFYTNWLPEKNIRINGLLIEFMANGEQEFSQLFNASLDFGECYDFYDEFVESWRVYYRDEPEGTADFTEVHEEWRGK